MSIDFIMTATWLDLARANVGDKVVFPAGCYVYPLVQVPVGMTGTVVKNSLNDELDAEMRIRPDDEYIRVALAEWNGEIVFGPDPDLSIGADENRWEQLSPIELVKEKS
jgi:hypothetical protein